MVIIEPSTCMHRVVQVLHGRAEVYTGSTNSPCATVLYPNDFGDHYFSFGWRRDYVIELTTNTKIYVKEY